MIEKKVYSIPPPAEHRPRRKRRGAHLSDEEMAQMLSRQPSSRIEDYREPTDEEWAIIARNSRAKLTKGLDKWL